MRSCTIILQMVFDRATRICSIFIRSGSSRLKMFCPLQLLWRLPKLQLQTNDMRGGTSFLGPTDGTWPPRASDGPYPAGGFFLPLFTPVGTGFGPALLMPPFGNPGGVLHEQVGFLPGGWTHPCGLAPPWPLTGGVSVVFCWCFVFCLFVVL